MAVLLETPHIRSKIDMFEISPLSKCMICKLLGEWTSNVTVCKIVRFVAAHS